MLGWNLRKRRNHGQKNIYLVLLIFFLCGLSTIGLGIILSSFTNNREQIEGITILILLPLAFISGTFMPVEILLSWASAIGSANYTGQAVPLKRSDSSTDRWLSRTPRLVHQTYFPSYLVNRYPCYPEDLSPAYRHARSDSASLSTTNISRSTCWANSLTILWPLPFRGSLLGGVLANRTHVYLDSQPGTRGR